MSLKLVVEILGDAKGLAKSLDEGKSDVGGFGSAIGGSALKIAAVAGVAAVAAGAIAEMTTAAVEDAAEQARLEAALKAAGVATGDYTTKVEDAIAAGQDRAFTDTQTRDALQSLVTATGDLGAATSQLTVAQDIARFANVDLATAADAVAKAHAGSDGALRKLMPGLAKGADATATLAAATKTAAGSADAYASSAAGMQDRAGDAFGELSETIGEIFIPILEELLPAIIPILRTLGELVKAILPILTPMLRVLATVLGIVARVLGVVVGWLTKLVQWMTTAIGKVGDFLSSINPLQGITLPSLPFLSSSPAAMAGAGAGVGRSAGRTAAPGGAIPAGGITIYTTGDGIEAEQAVVRALRRVSRLNGGVIPAASGWIGG